MSKREILMPKFEKKTGQQDMRTFFLRFWTFLGILGLGKKCLLFKNQISKIDLVTLKTNFSLQTIYLCNRGFKF